MVEVLTPREVPLGGLRAMTVRRTLPQRARSLVGAWCFCDHYGPDDVTGDGGMLVTPHPHTGLQTVSWLFTGEIEHVDSAGHRSVVRPGELNLMTAGRGISHSEVSTPATSTLHGVQLWVALPDGARFVEPGFEHHVPEPVVGDGWSARVFVGSLLGSTSPVTAYSPLVGAELLLSPSAALELPVDPSYEHAVLLDSGDLVVDGTPLQAAELAYVAPGAASLRLASRTGARVVLIGGAPFGEQIVMWWNFVGRTDAEVRAARDGWTAQLDPNAPGGVVDGPFGVVAGGLPPIPAPELPHATMRPRG